MLNIHRSERADVLVEVLGTLLRNRPADPFALEVVAVPTRGIERWLSQQLSAQLGTSAGRTDGVCANVEFPSPRRLLDGALAEAAGFSPEDDPWAVECLAWPLLETIDESLGEPWLEDLTAYLGGVDQEADPIRRARRLGVARHLANLYGRYSLYRPSMLIDWVDGAEPAEGDDSTPDAAAWQAELWRRLLERVGSPSPPERMRTACERLRDDPAAVELPDRLAIFGVTRLAASDLQILAALGATREVHVLVLHPSPRLWEALESKAAIGQLSRSADLSLNRVSNQLLASWGADSRELQLVLASASEAKHHHHPAESDSETLLGRVQRDVRENRPPPGIPPSESAANSRPELEPDDRSIQVHACHGRARQVEVLRDAILHELALDPTLEPRDVIVMCPDIETFAPLIQATFGAGELSREADLERVPGADRPTDLRVRLADRSLRQTNPILAAVSELLELPDRRLTASELLDFASLEPIRRRFGFDDDDLAQLQAWVGESGVRWGLDAGHRAPYMLDGLSSGTWRLGLDRMLVGVAMSEDGLRRFAHSLPLDDVSGRGIDLVGRLAELLSRIESAFDSFEGEQTIDQWVAAITAATDELAATTDRNAWQRAELRRILDEIVLEAAADGAAPTAAVSLREVRGLLADRLAGRPTRGNFRTGHLTICTLMPMRSVPHRVVCLLGLDDDAFPRKALRDGDDLMLSDPHVGDRDPRAEDRQLLLDALLAARDRLIITFEGNDERTNALRPPAVPVGELLAAIDATVRVDGGRARDQVLTRHPLQPFDPRNFVKAELIADRPWSFDQVALNGSQAVSRAPIPSAPFLVDPLPPAELDVIELDDLVAFLGHPVRGFLRQRLGISVSEYADEIVDDLSIELDGLERWVVGDRLLRVLRSGADGGEAVKAEIARGSLPPGQFGRRVIDDVYPDAEALARASRDLTDGVASESISVRVALDGCPPLMGTVAGVFGGVVHSASFSRLAPKHRLGSWARLLALIATKPERNFRAATLGRAERGSGMHVAELSSPVDGTAEREAWAHRELTGLIDLYRRGLREPLPLYCKTSAAYARGRLAGGDAVAAARKEWKSEFNWPREDAEREHELVLGGVRSFDEIAEAPARADEAGEDWSAEEPLRFGRYARRLWDGLLAVEEVGSP